MWNRTFCLVVLAAAAGLLLGFAPLPPTPPLRPPPRPLDPAATRSALDRLCLSPRPDRLADVHLLAREAWTSATPGGDPDVETDRVEFYHAVPIEIQQTENGQPLAPGPLQHQQKAAAAVKKLVDAALDAGAAPGRLLDLNGEIWSLARFEAQFDWTGEQADNGQILLHFTPAPHLHPGSRMQRILSRSAGVLRIDAATGQLLGGEFHSLGPVKFGAGLLANIHQFTGSFDLQPAGDGWVMKHVEVRVQGRELFSRLNGTETMDYTVASR